MYIFLREKRNLCGMLGLGQMGWNCWEKSWKVLAFLSLWVKAGKSKFRVNGENRLSAGKERVFAVDPDS